MIRPPTPPTGGAGAKVTVDGQPKQVDGAVVCSTTDGVPGDTATATKDGNTYTIKGNASGSDATGKQVSKPFEIVATCP
jgi:lipoprotein LpqH